MKHILILPINELKVFLGIYFNPDCTVNLLLDYLADEFNYCPDFSSINYLISVLQEKEIIKKEIIFGEEPSVRNTIRPAKRQYFSLNFENMIVQIFVKRIEECNLNIQQAFKDLTESDINKKIPEFMVTENEIKTMIVLYFNPNSKQGDLIEKLDEYFNLKFRYKYLPGNIITGLINKNIIKKKTIHKKMFEYCLDTSNYHVNEYIKIIKNSRTTKDAYKAILEYISKNQIPQSLDVA